ncbi:MAG TPA: hypothetical protein VGR39_07740, partial [Candidatus Acidoferrales bacterium]|nr:hypothetical protein [Candidatus Acidoferrales bacterium]
MELRVNSGRKSRTENKKAASAAAPFHSDSIRDSFAVTRIEVTRKNSTLVPEICQVLFYVCRCKMRMSGLSKVEMSAFMEGRGGRMETERIALSQPERDRLRVLHEV